MPNDATEPLATVLAESCERTFGPGTLEHLTRLSGGASQETWSFGWSRPGQPVRALIARRDAAEENPANDRATEFALMQLAREAGVQIPELYALVPASRGAGELFIMARVEGETIARKILRDAAFADARPKLAQQCAHALAKIHAIDLARLPALEGPPSDEPLARWFIERERTRLDELDEPHPAFELGLAWLAANAPREGRRTLVHGDFRTGNLIVGPDGLRAVLDWELAHLGDPLEDLGWLCVKSWRFGNSELPVGGFGTREALYEAYAEASGHPVSPQAVHFWEVYGVLKWGLICMLQAHYHRRGVKRSVELAALGRRTAETELDLLNLIS